MKNYLLTLLFVSALTGSIVYLSTGSGYEKHLRYLCTLLTLLALLSPLPTLFSTFESTPLPEIPQQTTPSSEYGLLLKKKTEERLNEELTYKITEYCDLPENEFSVECHIALEQESLMVLDNITVKLHTLAATVKREQIRSELLPVCSVVHFKEEPASVTKGETDE